MRSILICHPGRCGSHWLLYMLKRLTGLETLPEEPQVPPPEGHIWGTTRRREDIDTLRREMDVIFLLRDPRDVETSMRLYPMIEAADDLLNTMSWYRWYLEQQGTCTVYYEYLWALPLRTIKEAMLDMARYTSWDKIRSALDQESFETRTGRKRGEEDVSHHLRKGVIGDWRNHWDEIKTEAFMARFSKEMSTLGY